MKSIKHSYTFYLEQMASTLFPLFSAEGEKLWVPNWDYTNIMGSTHLCEDYIFLTKNHDHANPSTDAIWLVKQYKPEDFFVEFYKVEPAAKVGIISVQCVEAEEKGTHVTVTYCYQALSADGEAFIADFTEDAYEAFILEWKTLLEIYFKK